MAAAGLILAVTVQPAAARAYVYWTTERDWTAPRSPTEPGHWITRANLDGTGVKHIIGPLSRPASDLVVTGNHLFWTRSGDAPPRGIGHAQIDGGRLDELHVSAPNLWSLAAYGSHVYWADGSYALRAQSTWLGRARFDGTQINRDFRLGENVHLGPDGQPVRFPEGIALDRRYIYLSSPGSGTIRRIPREGSGETTDLIRNAGSPSGLAVDDRYIYWKNGIGWGSIGRAKLDGSDANPTFVSEADTGGQGSGGGTDVAVGDEHLYWVNQCCIGRAKLDGSEANPNFITREGRVNGVAVDRAPDTLIDAATQRRKPRTLPDLPGLRELPRWRVTFRFSSSQLDSRFICSLNGSAYRPCTSPKVYDGLPVGTHTFRVRAKSPQSLTDRSAAARRFRLRDAPAGS